MAVIWQRYQRRQSQLTCLVVVVVVVVAVAVSVVGAAVGVICSAAIVAGSGVAITGMNSVTLMGMPAGKHGNHCGISTSRTTQRGF